MSLFPFSLLHLMHKQSMLMLMGTIFALAILHFLFISYFILFYCICALVSSLMDYAIGDHYPPPAIATKQKVMVFNYTAYTRNDGKSQKKKKICFNFA